MFPRSYTRFNSLSRTFGKNARKFSTTQAKPATWQKWAALSTLGLGSALAFSKSFYSDWEVPNINVIPVEDAPSPTIEAWKEFEVLEVKELSNGVKVIRISLGEASNKLGASVPAFINIRKESAINDEFGTYYPINVNDDGFLPGVVEIAVGPSDQGINEHLHGVAEGDNVSISGPWLLVDEVVKGGAAIRGPDGYEDPRWSRGRGKVGQLFGPLFNQDYMVKLNKKTPVVLLATGTGIAGVYQTARGLLSRFDKSIDVKLIYSTKKGSLLKDELNSLAKEHPNLSIQYLDGDINEQHLASIPKSTNRKDVDPQFYTGPWIWVGAETEEDEKRLVGDITTDYEGVFPLDTPECGGILGAMAHKYVLTLKRN